MENFELKNDGYIKCVLYIYWMGHGGRVGWPEFGSALLFSIVSHLNCYLTSMTLI